MLTLLRVAQCYPFFYLMVLIAMVSLPMSVFAFGGYIEQRTFGHSQGAPFSAINDGWDSPIFDGSVSRGYSWSEIGAHAGRWSLGVLQRYDSEIHYSPDTLELLKAIKKQQPLTTGREYELFLTMNYMESQGTRLSYTFGDSNNWRVTVGGSYLVLNYLVSGKLQGHATATSDKSYDFQFDVDYLYSKDSLFSRPISQPQGNGYTFDVTYFWKPNENITLRGEILDIYSWFQWPTAPRTVAKGDSATKKYDSNGYQYFSPTFSGRETTEAYRQRFAPRAIIDFEFREHRTILIQRNHFIDEDIYPAVGMGRVFSNREFYSYYVPKTGGITAVWRTANGDIELGSDHWNPQKAHYGELRISLLVGS